jgi:hypothetical protein
LSTPNSKIKELELSPEIKQMGFTSARFIGKLLSLTHKSGATITSHFDMNNIPTSIKKLQNAIAANNKVAFDESYHHAKFSAYFAQMLLSSVEQEYTKRESERTRDQEDKQKIIDEINKDRSDLGEISLEDWEKTRRKKFNSLRKTVRKNLPSIWLPLEFALSIKCIINISKHTLPFAGIVLGAPSTLKTASLIMLSKWPQTFYTDHFTSRSLVSHTTGVPGRTWLKLTCCQNGRTNLFYSRS